MKIGAFVSLKGGSSKSSICRNAAVAAMMDGYHVTIMDTDPQGTLRQWSMTREGKPPVVEVELSSNRAFVRQTIDRIRDSGTELLFIDTQGSLDAAQTVNAIAVADLVITPCQPTDEDLGSFWQTEERVRDSNKPFVAIVSIAPTTTPKPGNDLLATFARNDVTACPTIIHARRIVPTSYTQGLAVMEMPSLTGPDAKAAAEFTDVSLWLRQQLQIEPKR